MLVSGCSLAGRLAGWFYGSLDVPKASRLESSLPNMRLIECVTALLAN